MMARPQRQEALVTSDPSSIKALTFDVFGTVVDWRTSIIRESAKGLPPPPGRLWTARVSPMPGATATGRP